MPSGKCCDMIELHGVSYAYPEGSSPALLDVDLTIPDGQWLLLAGPSGGGKSTLLYLLNGLIPHIFGGNLTGRIRVDGDAPGDVPLRTLSRRVGTVFQNPESQLFMLRVEEDAAFGCENLGLPPAETRRRVEQVLEQLSLVALRNQEVFTLSGGQKQRAAIAGALAMGCRTLLLDEPTSDLDEPSRAELLEALADLHCRGYTIVMTEHRLEGLDRLVDRTVTIDAGRIVSNGPAVAEPPPLRHQSARGAKISTPLVDLQGVTFAHPGREPVLNRLSLQLAPGETTALVGLNGSGKTTLLKLLCGLLRPTEGRAVIADQEAPSLAQLVGKVGFLFQNPDEQLFADTAAEEIAFGPKNMGRSVDIDRYLERLGLARHRNEHPRCLSRGQRQRLAAAAVLALQPKLILLDEPTTGLDRKTWTTLMEYVADEADACGAAVLFSTHHHEVVDAFADRVLTLSEGRIADDRLL